MRQRGDFTFVEVIEKPLAVGLTRAGLKANQSTGPVGRLKRNVRTTHSCHDVIADDHAFDNSAILVFNLKCRFSYPDKKLS